MHAYGSLLSILCITLALGALAGNPNIEVHHVRPNSEGNVVSLPGTPTNAYFQVSYPAVIQDIRPLKAKGQCWVTRIENLNDDMQVHHSIAMMPLASASYAQPGQPLYGAADGDVLLDSLFIGNQFSLVLADQAGLRDLDLLAPDEDDSVANGYTYGMPICHMDADYIVWQFHAHPPANHTEGEPFDVPIHYKMRTTSVPPAKNVGYHMSGSLGWSTAMEQNEDGTYVLDVTNRGGLLSCASNPESTPCVDCCNQAGTIPYADDFAFGRMEQNGILSYEIIGGFVHAHHTQHALSFTHIPLGGEPTELYTCNECGHGAANPDAFKWLDAPVAVRAGDAFNTRCEYKRHHGMNMPITIGFRSDQEMCNAFFLIAYEGEANYLGSDMPLFVPMAGICEAYVNPGYANGRMALPQYASICMLPPCLDQSTYTSECLA